MDSTDGRFIEYRSKLIEVHSKLPKRKLECAKKRNLLEDLGISLSSESEESQSFDVPKVIKIQISNPHQSELSHQANNRKVCEVSNFDKTKMNSCDVRHNMHESEGRCKSPALSMPSLDPIESENDQRKNFQGSIKGNDRNSSSTIYQASRSQNRTLSANDKIFDKLKESYKFEQLQNECQKCKCNSKGSYPSENQNSNAQIKQSSNIIFYHIQRQTPTCSCSDNQKKIPNSIPDVNKVSSTSDLSNSQQKIAASDVPNRQVFSSDHRKQVPFNQNRQACNSNLQPLPSFGKSFKASKTFFPPLNQTNECIHCLNKNSKTWHKLKRVSNVEARNCSCHATKNRSSNVRCSQGQKHSNHRNGLMSSKEIYALGKTGNMQRIIPSRSIVNGRVQNSESRIFPTHMESSNLIFNRARNSKPTNQVQKLVPKDDAQHGTRIQTFYAPINSSNSSQNCCIKEVQNFPSVESQTCIDTPKAFQPMFDQSKIIQKYVDNDFDLQKEMGNFHYPPMPGLNYFPQNSINNETSTPSVNVHETLETINLTDINQSSPPMIESSHTPQSIPFVIESSNSPAITAKSIETSKTTYLSLKSSSYKLTSFRIADIIDVQDSNSDDDCVDITEPPPMVDLTQEDSDTECCSNPGCLLHIKREKLLLEMLLRRN